MRLSTNTSWAVPFVVALSIAACSGEPGESDLAAGEDAGAPASSVAGASEESAGSDASIRFVNFWVHDGVGAPVDVYARSGFGREELLFENVGFGDVVSGTVPDDATLLSYRTGEPDAGEGLGSPAYIVYEDLGHDIEMGVPLTVVLTYARPLRENDLAGAIDVFYDAGDYVSGGMPARPVEGELLVAFVNPAGRVSGEANTGFKFGTPGAGCLRPAGVPSGGSISVSAGGTSSMTYDLNPGVSPIAAYSTTDTQCTSPPLIGPVDVEVAAGARTYLFAYGTGPDDLRLLALPSGGY